MKAKQGEKNAKMQLEQCQAQLAAAQEQLATEGSEALKQTLAMTQMELAAVKHHLQVVTSRAQPSHFEFGAQMDEHCTRVNDYGYLNLYGEDGKYRNLPEKAAVLAAMSPAEKAAALAAMSAADRTAVLAVMSSPEDKAAALAAMTPEAKAVALAAMSPEDRAAALAVMEEKAVCVQSAMASRSQTTAAGTNLGAPAAAGTKFGAPQSNNKEASWQDKSASDSLVHVSKERLKAELLEARQANCALSADLEELRKDMQRVLAGDMPLPAEGQACRLCGRTGSSQSCSCEFTDKSMQTTSALDDKDPAAPIIAAMVSFPQMSAAERVAALELLTAEERVSVLVCLSPHERAITLQAMPLHLLTAEERAGVLASLPVEERTQALQAMPLELLSAEERAQLVASLPDGEQTLITEGEDRQATETSPSGHSIAAQRLELMKRHDAALNEALKRAAKLYVQYQLQASSVDVSSQGMLDSHNIESSLREADCQLQMIESAKNEFATQVAQNCESKMVAAKELLDAFEMVNLLTYSANEHTLMLCGDDQSSIDDSIREHLVTISQERLVMETQLAL